MSASSAKIELLSNIKRLAAPVVLLILVCVLTHIFTYDWELPAHSEHAGDVQLAQPGLSIQSRFFGQNCVYPPLQYAVCHLLLPDSPSEPDDMREACSTRIAGYRLIAAVMLTGIVLSLYFFCLLILGWSSGWSMFPAAAFALLPVVLFYSHTSNMDIPYLFWFALSVLAAGLAAKAEKKSFPLRSHLWNLLCGGLIACAFCTKDQVYAMYVLPAFYYVYWRWQEKRRLFYAVRPLLLWGAAFLPVTAGIYALIGWKAMLSHFTFIFGDGKNLFCAVPASLAGRLELIGLEIQSLSKALDLPVLLLLLPLVLLLFGRRFSPVFLKHRCLLFFLFAALLSQNLLFFQVVRTAYVRFQIPLCFVVLLFLTVLLQEAARHVHRRLMIIAVSLFFLMQAAVAGQFLYNLAFSPMVRLNRFLAEIPGRVVVPTASFGYYSVFDKTHVQKRKAVRSWLASSMELPPDRTAEIMPDLFSCFWRDSSLVVLPQSARENVAFQKELSVCFDPEQGGAFEPYRRIPTLFRLGGV